MRDLSDQAVSMAAMERAADFVGSIKEMNRAISMP